MNYKEAKKWLQSAHQLPHADPVLRALLQNREALKVGALLQQASATGERPALLPSASLVLILR